MRKLEKEFVGNFDENYWKKFGHLKKASVLSYYGRENDAHTEVAKACAIIKEQKVVEVQKQESIQRRWKFKLGLDDGFELPFQLDKQHPDLIDMSKYKLLEEELN